MAITSISLQAHPRQMAKPETVGKVCAIVKKQLSLDDTKKVNAETKFVDLGADSLDTVEIVMRLEEEFGIEMAEEKAQTITTIEQAAELIEEMLMDKAKYKSLLH